MARLHLVRYRFCAVVLVCWLASGITTRGALFQFSGRLHVIQRLAVQDFLFRPLQDSNFLSLATFTSTGGTNLAGESIASGGIDSTLSLLTVPTNPAIPPAQIAFNDDKAAGNRDSLLSYGGSGITYLAPQPLGNYRLRLANYMSSIGDARWAVDLYNATESMVVTQFASSNSTLKSLTFGELYPADGLATLNWSSGRLGVLQPFRVRTGGTLNHSGGSLTAPYVDVDGGTINVTNGADISVVGDMPVRNGGRAIFDGPGTTLTADAVRVGTFGFSLTQSLNSAIVFQNGAAGTVSGTVNLRQDNDAAPGTATGASFGVESGATVVVGDFDWTPIGVQGQNAVGYVNGLGSSLTVLARKAHADRKWRCEGPAGGGQWGYVSRAERTGAFGYRRIGND